MPTYRQQVVPVVRTGLHCGGVPTMAGEPATWTSSPSSGRGFIAAAS